MVLAHPLLSVERPKIRKMAKGDAKMFRKLSGELIRTNKTDESLYYPYFPKPCGAKPNKYCVPRKIMLFLEAKLFIRVEVTTAAFGWYFGGHFGGHPACDRRCREGGDGV